MNLICRPARDHDRESWAALRYELWPECPERRHALEVSQLLASDGLVVIAEVNGTVAGFAEISIRRDHVEGTESSPAPYLEGWFVRPGFRGKGVGRALIAFAESWAVEQGFRELASDAELCNAHSIHLHQLLGFREVGRSVHFVKPLMLKGRRAPGS